MATRRSSPGYRFIAAAAIKKSGPADVTVLNKLDLLTAH